MCSENRNAPTRTTTARTTHTVVLMVIGCGSGGGAPVGRRWRRARWAGESLGRPTGAAVARRRSSRSLHTLPFRDQRLCPQPVRRRRCGGPGRVICTRALRCTQRARWTGGPRPRRASRAAVARDAPTASRLDQGRDVLRRLQRAVVGQDDQVLRWDARVGGEEQADADLARDQRLQGERAAGVGRREGLEPQPVGPLEARPGSRARSGHSGGPPKTRSGATSARSAIDRRP